MKRWVLAAGFWLGCGLLGGWASPAVVTVPVATVHAQADGSSETVTQVPFCDRVEVLRTAGSWIKVWVPDQYRLSEGYPGWMLRHDVTATSQPSPPFVIVTSPRAQLRSQPDASAPIQDVAFMGSHLPVAGTPNKDGWWTLAVPGHQAPLYVSQSQIAIQPVAPDGADVVRMAEEFLHTRYVWGGISIDGIDCSGLTFMVYRVHGIILPRDADQQFEVGEPVAQDALQPGDLVFYGRSRTHITHVALYAGHGQVVEASSAAHHVQISSLHHRRDFQGARRVIGVTLHMPPPSP